MSSGPYTPATERVDQPFGWPSRPQCTGKRSGMRCQFAARYSAEPTKIANGPAWRNAWATPPAGRGMRVPFPASARRGGVRHRVFSRAQESVQHAASLPGDAGERGERLPSGNSDKGDGETNPRVNPHLDAKSPDDTPRVAGVAECGINRDGEEDVATGDFGQEMEENGYQDERRREGCDQRPQNRIACDYRCWRCGHVREHAQSPLAEAQALTWRA